MTALVPPRKLVCSGLKGGDLPVGMVVSPGGDAPGPNKRSLRLEPARSFKAASAPPIYPAAWRAVGGSEGGG